MTAVAKPETPGTSVAPSVPAKVEVVHTLRPLVPTAAPAALIAQQNATRAFVTEVLAKDTDYGIIPGTKKPTMLKPGAEKVTLGFGLSVSSSIVEREVDHDRVVTWTKRKMIWEGARGSRKSREEITEGTSVGVYRYVVRVDLIDADGVLRGSGLGSCSTMESKYIDRPRDSENTVLKMAFKRAHVAATLTTLGLSDAFTQDVEDLPHVAEQADVPPEAFAMPFGESRGTPIGELETKDIEGALRWAREKGKFDEFQVAADAVLKARAEVAEGKLREPAVAVPQATTDPVHDDTLTAITDAIGSIADADKRQRAKAKWEKMRLEGATEAQAQDVLSRLLALEAAPPAGGAS